ncbi:MAG: methyltransferase domain-containing protein [Deltaproteobacteria bacterium]|nr:methyltransferase domain-containing protein [Deltaproteobacteria bacterium]MBN2674805.1 methyltransferase domain-containing protein [Deltaproteobacteria bacterium]
MNDHSFHLYTAKLQQNVYSTAKGHIRLTLLRKDIEEFVPSFSSPPLRVLDVGCGGGQFAKICLDAGHRVRLLDANEEMICSAAQTVGSYIESGAAALVCEDFQQASFASDERFDLVLMHGSAEWMPRAEDAILNACDLLAPGGYLSLLMYNQDTHILKKGINGHLLGRDPNKKRKLFPPGALGVADTAAVLSRRDGTIQIQSGIRIFHKFFRHIDTAEHPISHWLNQEIKYFRTPPFSLLGQHSHFIWKKSI